MPLQNRVDPFGQIHAVPDRGMLTGNRGIVHDPSARTLLARRWTTKAWIICVCEFRGRRRRVMGPGPNGNGSWTELFFLDEVTALAAGHRPCYYCRRPAAVEFSRKFGGTADVLPRAPVIDAKLHGERLAVGTPAEKLDPAKLSLLPDGAMIAVDGDPYALRRGVMMKWTFSGYGSPIPAGRFDRRNMTSITPASTRAALAAGYQPLWHPTAGP